MKMPKLIDSPRRTSRIKRSVHRLNGGGWGYGSYRIAGTKRDAMRKIDTDADVRRNVAFRMHCTVETIIVGQRVLRRIKRENAATT